MSSIKEFVSKVLEPEIIKDAKEFRIFNEADLQARVATHLQKKYISEHRNLYLLNQPSIRIGKGRGAERARPDLVVCELNGTPNSSTLAAFELKCYLADADVKVPIIQSSIEADIEALRKFRQRFFKSGNEYAFIIALLDIEDEEKFKGLDKEFKRNRVEWMKHFLKVHLINMRTEIRRGYDQWADQWWDRQLKA
jgi:hypothetical protein